MAIDGIGLIIALGAEFNTGHVPQLEHALCSAGAQDDIAELIGLQHTAPGRHGIDELLALGCGIGADFAGSVLGVLRVDGVGDVLGRQSELRHAVGLEPNAHRVITGTEHDDVRRARNALEFIDDILGCVVGQIEHVACAVGRI